MALNPKGIAKTITNEDRIEYMMPAYSSKFDFTLGFISLKIIKSTKENIKVIIAVISHLKVIMTT